MDECIPVSDLQAYVNANNIAIGIRFNGVPWRAMLDGSQLRCKPLDSEVVKPSVVFVARARASLVCVGRRAFVVTLRIASGCLAFVTQGYAWNADSDFKAVAARTVRVPGLL